MSYGWTIEDLALAGNAAGNWGGRLSGMGDLGKIKTFTAATADVADAQRRYETTYGQIQSLTNQLASAVNEVAAAAQGVSDPEILSLLDDAKLLADQAASSAAESRRIYELKEDWVRSAVDPMDHGDWAFGREYIVGGGGASAPGNRSGRPLDSGHKNKILNVAAGQLQKVVAEVSQALGQIRALRQQVVVKAQAFASAERVRLENEARAAAAQKYKEDAEARARQLQEDRERRAQELEQRREAAAEAAEQRRIEFEERKQAALEAAEQRKVAMQEQLEQSRLQAEQTRIQQQIQAEAQQVAMQQQAQERALAMEAAKQDALMQAELQKTYAQFSQQGTMSVPAYGAPPGMLPGGGGGFVDPGAGYARAPEVVGPPQPDSGWNPSGELFGMGAVQAQPGLLDSISSFLTRVGPVAADVGGALQRRGQPAAPAYQESSGGISGTTLLGLAAAGVGIWFLVKGKKLPGKKRSRRRGRR